MGSMMQGKTKRRYDSITAAIWQACPALHKAIQPPSGSGDTFPLFESVRLSFTSGRWLAIAHARELASLRSVVCFGAGDTMGDALRALSLNIGRGRWSADKYAK